MRLMSLISCRVVSQLAHYDTSRDQSDECGMSSSSLQEHVELVANDCENK